MYQKLLISEKIVQNISDLIIKGYYLPGDKLPNELVLSEELNVSRASLREAFKILESKHIIEVKRGKGTYIAAIPGLAQDPLGSVFFEFNTEKDDIFNTMIYIGIQILDTRLSLDEAEKQSFSSFLSHSLEGSNALKRILSGINLLAKISRSTYLERLWQIHLNMLKLNGVLESDLDFDVYLLALLDAVNKEDEAQIISVFKQVIIALK